VCQVWWNRFILPAVPSFEQYTTPGWLWMGCWWVCRDNAASFEQELSFQWLGSLSAAKIGQCAGYCPSGQVQVAQSKHAEISGSDIACFNSGWATYCCNAVSRLYHQILFAAYVYHRLKVAFAVGRIRASNSARMASLLEAVDAPQVNLQNALKIEPWTPAKLH
jgi:hypothetical protein